MTAPTNAPTSRTHALTVRTQLRDAGTMLRRNLLHAKRYPSLTVSGLALPIVFLLLFVYVLGGAIGVGLEATADVRYIDYLVPGIIVMSISAASTSTAVAVCSDMTEGIIARFRTMSIARSSVLTGHVLGSMLQTVASIVAVVLLAVLIGFRPTAGPVEWLGVVGVVLLLTFAMTWLAVALGMVSPNPEGAGNVTIPFIMLPFMGSTFVPTDTMPAGLAAFAEHQPFTPIIETLRGLLLGTPIGSSAVVAVAWCVGFALLGYLWARRAYERPPSR